MIRRSRARSRRLNRTCPTGHDEGRDDEADQKSSHLASVPRYRLSKKKIRNGARVRHTLDEDSRSKVDIDPLGGSHRSAAPWEAMMSSVELESGTSQQQPIYKPDPPATRKRLRSPIDRQRAEFLRQCRARIDPSELGLPRSRIKRTEGLRREDVASL